MGNFHVLFSYYLYKGFIICVNIKTKEKMHSKSVVQKSEIKKIKVNPKNITK